MMSSKLFYKNTKYIVIEPDRNHITEKYMHFFGRIHVRFCRSSALNCSNAVSMVLE